MSTSTPTPIRCAWSPAPSRTCTSRLPTSAQRFRWQRPPLPGPTAPRIVGAAHTNNDQTAATSTTLVVLDGNLNQLSLQSPANAGFFVATGKFAVFPSEGGQGI
ncbi:MAG: DUF4394 domain-containing protein [Burkholderiaceae bacterium]